MSQMSKFRWHRGGLAESMETTRPCRTMEDLILILHYGGATGEGGAGEIEVKPYTYDERIGWDTYIVTVDGAAVGFTDGAIDAPNV